MKLIKKIVLVLIVAFVVAQFFGPDKNQGELSSIDPFLAETNPPEGVKLILKESCFDCHSSFTRYPWYNNITPVNYWMDGHIDHAKSHLNFSIWDQYDLKKKDHKFEEMIDMVEARTMPLESYTWMHAEANLSDAQIKAVVDWAMAVRAAYSIEDDME